MGDGLKSSDAERALDRAVELVVARQLLAHVVKVCREDRAVTPGVTRLARLCSRIERYLSGQTSSGRS